MNDLPYEPIDHTADAGYRVRGATLPELFANAARCLFDALGGAETARPASTHDIAVEAEGHPALLRAWLSELLYISYVRKLVLISAEIVALDERHIAARVTGEDYDEARHERNPEIKAVTWHDLSVERTATGWEAVFILDL